MLNKKQQEALDSAIILKDLPQIIKLLEKDGIDPNFKITGWYMLHYATLASNTDDIVLTLLQYGANPNVTNGANTPLHIAAGERSIVKIQHLLDYGAKINSIGARGDTPLHNAVMSFPENKEKTVKLLLEKGANREIKNSDGKTALQIAEERGYTEIVEIFKEVPVNIEQASNINQSFVLSLTSFNGKIIKNEELKVLLEDIVNRFAKEADLRVVVEIPLVLENNIFRFYLKEDSNYNDIAKLILKYNTDINYLLCEIYDIKTQSIVELAPKYNYELVSTFKLELNYSQKKFDEFLHDDAINGFQFREFLKEKIAEFNKNSSLENIEDQYCFIKFVERKYDLDQEIANGFKNLKKTLVQKAVDHPTCGKFILNDLGFEDPYADILGDL